jgi:S-adenosylmethionine decarboxylase
MQGLYLIADLHHCRDDSTLLVDAPVLLQLCMYAVDASVLQAVTLDVYVCNFGGDHSAKAHRLMDALLAVFKPGQTERQTLHRGELSA